VYSHSSHQKCALHAPTKEKKRKRVLKFHQEVLSGSCDEGVSSPPLGVWVITGLKGSGEKVTRSNGVRGKFSLDRADTMDLVGVSSPLGCLGGICNKRSDVMASKKKLRREKKKKKKKKFVATYTASSAPCGTFPSCRWLRCALNPGRLEIPLRASDSKTAVRHAISPHSLPIGSPPQTTPGSDSQAPGSST